MTKVLFKRKTSDEIANLPVEDGALIYNYETGATYLDYGDERIPTGGGMPTGDTFPIGAITPYAGDTAPVNWLICDGRAISRTTYADLFDAIGTTYGVGDGSTTFNLPNLKGRVITGLDSSQTEFDTLGEIGGEKTHTLTVEEMPSHYHNLGWSETTDLISQGQQGVPNSNAHIIEDWKTSNVGGNQPHNILQPYITLNYIIKAFQSSGTVANVATTETNSDTDTYSCNYINNIVEKGSNSNGEYIKFANGTLINTKIIEGNASALQWTQYIGYADIENGNWALNFNTLYNCQVTNATNQFWSSLYNPSITSAGRTRLSRPYDTTENMNYKIHIFAIGTWK